MSIRLKPGLRTQSPLRRRHQIGLATVAAVAGLTGPLLHQSLARAASPFGSEPVASGQVIALAQPISADRWNLVVFEQREPAPPCWRRHADGSVTTYEMHLSEATCGRYLSSNAYSLRVAGNDLRHPWRLRIENNNGQLRLLASGSQQPQPLVVGSGRAAGTQTVELQLADGWGFERRTYDGQRLSHVYMANANPLPVLMAQARNGGSGLLAALPLIPPPPAEEEEGRRRTIRSGGSPRLAPRPADSSSASGSRLARLENLRLGRSRSQQPEAFENSLDSQDNGGVIALQVVPYQP